MERGLGTYSGSDGSYGIDHVAAGSYTVMVRRRGYAADSFVVTVRAGEAATHDIVLRPAAQNLEGVIISASPRLNETTEQALEKQRNADNIVTILSGDVIRALPNANAAEAAARIPGISTERDEGEGKFVRWSACVCPIDPPKVSGVRVVISMTAPMELPELRREGPEHHVDAGDLTRRHQSPPRSADRVCCWR